MATTATTTATTGEDELSIQSALWRKRQSINSEIAAFTHQKEIEYRELEKLLRTTDEPERPPNPSPREHAQFAGVFAPTFLPLLDERYRIPERAATPPVKKEEPKEETTTTETEATNDVKATKDVDTTKAVKPTRPSPPRSHPSALRIRRKKSLKRVTFEFDDEDRVPSRSSPPTDSSASTSQSELVGELLAELVAPEGQSRDASPPAIPPPPAESNTPPPPPPPPPASTFSFANATAMSPNGYDDSDGEEGLFDLDETMPPPSHHEPPHRDPISPLLPPSRENNHPVALPNASYTNSYKPSYTGPSPMAFPKTTPISFSKQPPSSFGAQPRSSLSEGFFHTPLHISTVPASLPVNNFPRLQQNSLRQRSIAKYIPSPPPESAAGSPVHTPATETPNPQQLVGSLPMAISGPSTTPKAPVVTGASAAMLPGMQSPYRTKFAQQVAEEALMAGGGEGYVGGSVDVDPGSVPMGDVGGFSFSRKLEMEMEKPGRRGGRV